MLALGSPSAPVAWPAAAARLSAQPAVLGQRVFMEPGSSPASGHFPERCGGKAVHLVWKAARVLANHQRQRNHHPIYLIVKHMLVSQLNQATM